MSDIPHLGSLEYVAVREVWAHEAHVFTPWLLQNANHLGDALGMDLELTGAEHPVGNFSLDLIGHDLSTGERVIVENQLERTDHGHLGQLLTYAAGVEDVANIVWVAPTFQPEHRAALDWLNTRTGEGTRFFGVEVAAVRIATSPYAPLFRVVSQPNDWQKIVKNAAQSSQSISSRAGLYREFWEQFLDRLKAAHPTWSRGRAPQANYFEMTAGSAGLRWGVSFTNSPGVRSELYFGHSDGVENDRIYQRLARRAAEFETAFGGRLVWDPLPGKKACRVEAPQITGEVDDTERWPEFLDWMVDTQSRLRSALVSIGGVNWLVDASDDR
ncbi:protein of unknown function [Klenkia soli]|uniref:DUF4268 domain-containing protein n=1 Tax=Klenkia soli TaxID=1052260 RepID=A0A1H0Q1W8_9ACTN|nr:DUF4268 domain-containing protein [Klenkia soli]SDP11334.1 protein of unknown function [Klenkia soli]